MTAVLDIPNITETYNGTKYAYEKEGDFNTEIYCECIEHGEEFYSTAFVTPKHTPKQLYDIGQDMAMSYGGECVSVGVIVSKNNDGSYQIIPIDRPC